MKSHRVKLDANHHAIVSALEQIGVGVLDTSGAAGGFCDIVTAQRGIWRMIEIKNPDGLNKLTLAQVRAHELARVHGCKIHIVRSVEEALALHGAR